MAWPYDTQRWLKLREKKLAEMPFCAVCTGYQDLEVHHVVPITDDERESRDAKAGYPVLDLLEVLCKSCHSLRTRGVSTPAQKAAQEWAQFLTGD